MTAKEIIKKLTRERAEGRTLSLLEMMALADAKPTDQQVTNLRPVITQLIQEHATGKSQT